MILYSVLLYPFAVMNKDTPYAALATEGMFTEAPNL